MRLRALSRARVRVHVRVLSVYVCVTVCVRERWAGVGGVGDSSAGLTTNYKRTSEVARDESCLYSMLTFFA